MDDDALARIVAGEVGVGIAEVAAGIARHVDHHRRWLLHPHLIRLQLRTSDGEVMGQRCRPFDRIGLLQVLLGLGLDGLAHLLRLRFERESKLAAHEQVLVHAIEDTDVGSGRPPARAAAIAELLSSNP